MVSKELFQKHALTELRLCRRCKLALCRCVAVTGYTKGPVAAGLAVVVSLEVLPRRHGAVREVVRVVAEDGIAEMVITGEVNP